MNFAYTILYVKDINRAIEFYEKAFDLKRRFLSPEGNYAEMDTGGTTLSFAAQDFIRPTLPGGFTENDPARPPAGIEIAFTTPDVPKAFRHAVKCGAAPVLEPVAKPWGQTVAYVRDLDGILVEIATPMSD